MFDIKLEATEQLEKCVVCEDHGDCDGYKLAKVLVTTKELLEEVDKLPENAKVLAIENIAVNLFKSLPI